MTRSPLFRKKSVGLILKDAASVPGSPTELRKSLTVFDLTALGIAAVIGAGIFSTIGTAAVNGGPAVTLLFLFTAVACGFSAMCYAEFASSIPISGSAYTYAYASFGELVAWIIGWDLIMEYAIGNIAVAISWSDYFTGFMGGIGLHIPPWLGIDYLSAARGYQQATLEMMRGVQAADLPGNLSEAMQAWLTAPMVGGVRIIADIPAFAIVVFISVLVFVGIYETKVAGNIMVMLKVGVLLLIITAGVFYVDPKNWSPFAPHGLTGVLKGVSAVFFAYIGFDAISTTAEECRDARRDLPRAILLALIITTVLYILISLVLTGLVPYHQLGVGDPLAYAFERLHMTKLSGVIAVSAVIAMASVLLVFQVGQPRIWMSMSRDGLLPPAFSKIHRRFRTPWFSTVIAGILVAIPSLFMNLTEVTDLTSIGTLFAFILVSGGVLVLQNDRKNGGWQEGRKGFRVPYIDSRWTLPVIWIGVGVVFWLASGPVGTGEQLINRTIEQSNNRTIEQSNNRTIEQSDIDLDDSISTPPPAPPQTGRGISTVIHHLPIALFVVAAVVITWFAVRRRLSLIPVMGLLTNLYLMAQLGVTNWLRFLIWLAIGLVIYFSYGRWHSRLGRK